MSIPTLLTLSAPLPLASPIPVLSVKRTLLPVKSHAYFQALVQQFRVQLLKSRERRSQYVLAVKADDEAVFKYFSSYFPEITLVESCANGGYTQATRIILGPRQGCRKTKGIISLLLAVPAACEVASARSLGQFTTAPAGLSIAQLHFVTLALLAHAVLDDMKNHFEAATLPGIEALEARVAPPDTGGWLLKLMRHQRNVVWGQPEEDLLLALRNPQSAPGPKSSALGCLSVASRVAVAPSSSRIPADAHGRPPTPPQAQQCLASPTSSAPSAGSSPAPARSPLGPRLPALPLRRRSKDSRRSSLTSSRGSGVAGEPTATLSPPPTLAAGTQLQLAPPSIAILPASPPVEAPPSRLQILDIAAPEHPASQTQLPASAVSIGHLPAPADLSSRLYGLSCGSPTSRRHSLPKVHPRSSEPLSIRDNFLPAAYQSTTTLPVEEDYFSLEVQAGARAGLVGDGKILEHGVEQITREVDEGKSLASTKPQTRDLDGYFRRESVGGWNCGSGRVVKAFVSLG